MLLPSPCSALHPNAPFLDENLMISRVNEIFTHYKNKQIMEKLEYEENNQCFLPSLYFPSFLKTIMK